MEAFKNIINDYSNKYSSKIESSFKTLYEELTVRGMSCSGEAVELSYKLINDNVISYLDELLKEISYLIRDYEFVLNFEELKTLFKEIDLHVYGLIDYAYLRRKEYLVANKLEDGRFDYKTNLIQKCTQKLNTEQQNMRVKIAAIEEKQKRQGISINNLYGQLNIGYDNSTINADNNTNNLKNDLEWDYNLRFGFKFLYPKTWDRFDPMNGDGSRFIHPTNEHIYISGSACFNVFEEDILDRSIQYEIRLKELPNYQFIRNCQSGKLVIIRDYQGNEIGREKLWGYKYSYIYGGEGVKNKVIEVITQYKNVDYTISCVAPVSEFLKYEDLFNYIVSEFYVIDGLGEDVISNLNKV